MVKGKAANGEIRQIHWMESLRTVCVGVLDGWLMKIYEYKQTL